MSLFNKDVLIFQITGDFFSDITHHVGSPLTALSLIYYTYMATIPLCIRLHLH